MLLKLSVSDYKMISMDAQLIEKSIENDRMRLKSPLIPAVSYKFGPKIKVHVLSCLENTGPLEGRKVFRHN